MIDNLDIIAATERMLGTGWALFSKKQSADTGQWWADIYRPITGGAEDSRVRGHGGSFAEAVEAAFEQAGLGGLRWKLAKLDVRMRALNQLLGGDERRPKEKPCPHGVSGGRCKKCI